MANNPQSASSIVRTPQFAIALALFLIPFAYFYPVLLGQVFLAPGDGWAQNLGVRALAGQMIASGQAPLWNPFIFGGMPLAASVYPGSFYPPNWLFAILSPKWAMNLVVLTTYHIALVGTYLYARRIGITRAGALIAGMAFTFGGFMINHLSHTSRIAAAAWLPWVLLAIENIAGSENWQRTWRWVMLGSLFIALQFFAGEPQMMVFTALVALPCALFAINRCEEHEDILRAVKALAVMLAVAVSLCLIQLLPSLELLAQSERRDPGAQFFDSYSLPPWQLPALVFPYFFGGALLPPYKMPYWGAEIAAVMSGYVGMLVWLLAAVALVGGRRNGRVWLWLGIAVIALVLAFGGYLPFGLNHLLYRVPGYKTFRGLYRHQFEFTFAMAMLAGLGMTYLSTFKQELARRALFFGTMALTVIVTVVAALYRFFGDRLATVTPRPPDAALLSNPEFLVPVVFFLLSVIALWFYAIAASPRRRVAASLLFVALLLDLASYGHFFHWRTAKFDVEARLADPPAVQLIKSREKDFNSFRVMSYPVQAYDYAYAWPEDPNFDLLNQPNTSILRGLQSISGYDILRPERVGQMTGTAGAVLNGYVQDAKSFGLEDQGFDLLNVKYLIVGYGGATGKKVGLEHDGVYFARTNFGAELKPGVKLTTTADGSPATEIAIVSSLANSTHLPDGAPILILKIHTRDGRIIERQLEAGRDTSEWAYDRADVKAAIKHQRARVAEDFDAGEFKSHAYLGRLKFDRAEIEKIEWVYAREDASLLVIRASLFDEATKQSAPLANFHLPPERWHSLGKFDQVAVYENLRAMPRAWFAKSIREQSNDEILKTIRSGLASGGEPYDPAKVTLIEPGAMKQGFYSLEDVKAVIAADALPPSERDQGVTIKRYEPARIEIETRGHLGGFLVQSEVYYDGWEARIDGQPTKIYRTDYTLRGVSVPAGNHRVEFVYRPRSFRLGAIGFAFGVIVLLIGGVFVHRRRF
ncbi:MAG: YfhO family protein [Acidobacteriota bacterium]